MNAIVISPMEVVVTWEEVQLISQNGLIIMYEILIQDESDLEVKSETKRPRDREDDLSLIVFGLVRDTVYNVSVRAYTSIGAGPYSSGLLQVVISDNSNYFHT